MAGIEPGGASGVYICVLGRLDRKITGAGMVPAR